MPRHYAKNSKRRARRAIGGKRAGYGGNGMKGYANSINLASGKTTGTKKWIRPGGSLRMTGPPPIGRGPLPQTIFTSHQYSGVASIFNDNTTGYTGSEFTWRLNSLHDPSTAVVGLLNHQPYGFDQFGGLYTNYLVYKVDIQFVIEYTSGVDLSLVTSIRGSGNTFNLGGSKDVGLIAEKPGCTAMPAVRGQTLNQTVWIADIEGVNRGKVFSEQDFSATNLTNPARVPTLGVACTSPGAVTGGEIVVRVNLNFHTRWSELFTQAQS